MARAEPYEVSLRGGRPDSKRLRPRSCFCTRASQRLCALLVAACIGVTAVFAFALHERPISVLTPPAATASLDARRLLWIAPRTASLDAQLAAVRGALTCARRTNRTLVLPPLHDGAPPAPPFAQYVDVEALRARAPVTTPIDLARTGVACKAVLHARNSPVKAVAALHDSYARRFLLAPVAAASAAALAAAPCADASACTGASAEARLAVVQPSQHVVKLAYAVRAPHTVYDAVHVRTRSECARARRKRRDTRCRPTSSADIVRIIRRLPMSRAPLFVTARNEAAARRLLARAVGRPLFFASDARAAPAAVWAKRRPAAWTLAERVVASEARVLVANRASAHSAHIVALRRERSRNATVVYF